MLAKRLTSSCSLLYQVPSPSFIKFASNKFPAANVFDNAESIRVESFDSTCEDTPDTYEDLLKRAKELTSSDRVKSSLYVKDVARFLNDPQFLGEESCEQKTFNSIVDKSKFTGKLVKLYNQSSEILDLQTPDHIDVREFQAKMLYELAKQLVLPGKFDFPTFEQDYESVKELMYKVLDTSARESTSKLVLLKRFMAGWSDKRIKLKKQEQKANNQVEKIKYEHPKNSILCYYSPTLLRLHQQKRLLTAQMHGQPMIIDMDFEQYSIINDLYKQLNKVNAMNRRMCHPFNLIYANWKNNSSDHGKKIHYTPNVWYESEIINKTEKSYLELEPEIERERLVYLTPDATTDMTEFHHDKVYIWAGLVDKCPQAGMTRTKAKSEGIKCERFPLEQYLKYGGIGARKNLNLTTVFEILAVLSETDNDWIKAFSVIPARFHRGLTELGKAAVNYDEKTIFQFESGQRWFDAFSERRELKPNIQKFVKPYFARS